MQSHNNDNDNDDDDNDNDNDNDNGNGYNYGNDNDNNDNSNNNDNDNDNGNNNNNNNNNYNNKDDDDGGGSSDPLKKFSDAIIPNLPLLMHGSGDVVPSQVDPGTTSLLAELVSFYVYDLVQAAVDAHDVLTDGAGGLLPPPPYIDATNDDDDEDDGDDSVRSDGGGRKRRRQEDNWETPLPLPRITGTDGGGPNRPLPPPSLPYDDPPFSWQGARGVNLFPHRIRTCYAATPTTIGTQCFIYPISHDAQLYNRVKTLLTEQKDFAEVMVNPTAVKVAQEDCDSILGNAIFGWVGLGLLDGGKDGDRRKDNENSGGEDGMNGDGGNLNEGGVSAEVEEKRRALAKALGLEVQWPGLEDLVPTTHH